MLNFSMFNRQQTLCGFSARFRVVRTLLQNLHPPYDRRSALSKLEKFPTEHSFPLRPVSVAPRVFQEYFWRRFDFHQFGKLFRFAQ